MVGWYAKRVLNSNDGLLTSSK